MASLNAENITLFSELYLKQEVISQVYSHVGSYTGANNLIEKTTKGSPKSKFFSFTYVPEYMKTEVSVPKLWTEKTFPSVNGYAIQINNPWSVDDYLRQQNKKQRENINRARRRLETCFDINYKVFQHQIQEEEYHFLMEQLRTMIMRRFEQRGQKSSTMAIWDQVLATSFELMKQKKASLFVIYDKDSPIAISFNYIYDRILFGYISSYHLDYGKFSLGQIVIYKLLEWCLQNKFSQYDMGWGDLEYKKWWCNKIYRFNHQICYQKYSISGFLFACFKGNRSRLLAFLISKRVNIYWKILKKKLKRDIKIPSLSPSYRFMEISLEETEKFNEINLAEKNLPITKQIINNFLFSTQEHSNNVTLHSTDTKDQYILKGRKSARLVVFNPVNQ
ncbi:MAG: GNAT family N-acetyltransferase [Bacteroidota bacterium]